MISMDTKPLNENFQEILKILSEKFKENSFVKEQTSAYILKMILLHSNIHTPTRLLVYLLNYSYETNLVTEM